MNSNRSPEEHALICLIRGEPLGPLLGSCTLEELSQLAQDHKIVALTAYALSRETGIPADWRKWAAINLLETERAALLWLVAARNTINLLESIGITPVVLKGLSLAMGTPRHIGDIDLLIPADSVLSAITLLEGKGFSYQGYDRNMYIRRNEYRDWHNLLRWSNQFEFTEPETGYLIELHTTFFETERVYAENLLPLRHAIGEFSALSIVDATTGLRFLMLEDRVLLLALHAGLKRSPDKKAFKLRHLTDLQNLVNAGLDWPLLEQRAFHFGIAHHLVFLLRLNELFLPPCSPPGFIQGLESKLAPSMVRLQRLHLLCLKDVGSYNRWAIFFYTLASPFIINSTLQARLRSLFVFPLLFPPVYKLVKDYGLPPRSRCAFLLYLLEPLQWIIRMVRKTFRIIQSVKI